MVDHGDGRRSASPSRPLCHGWQHAGDRDRNLHPGSSAPTAGISPVALAMTVAYNGMLLDCPWPRRRCECLTCSAVDSCWWARCPQPAVRKRTSPRACPHIEPSKASLSPCKSPLERGRFPKNGWGGGVRRARASDSGLLYPLRTHSSDVHTHRRARMATPSAPSWMS